ncbi:MAG: hypothetical protein IT322_11305 [Anaerolineae bacterium]|nr:hypothetical protein [Anaerolineae bacterium]CAG0982730.1 hypothetical protein ANRL4_01975 [Anaerolineae bacterium]
MDPTQLSRMIEWLDEERRRDKAKQAKVEEQITAQQELIEAMTRRLNALESENAALKTMFVPIERDGEIMEYLREEVRQSFEAAEAKRITAEREAERRAELAREALLRPMRDVTDRMDKLERLQDEINAARMERDRIASALSGLQQRVEDVSKKFEEPERRLSFLEEQRRQDSRRISELQTEQPELQKQIDGLRPKFDLIESLTLRNEKLILEVQNADRERSQKMQEFVDQQTLLTQQRESRVEELRQGFSQYEEDMRRRIERFETWAEAYRQMKRIIEDFERIADRLDRRINEVAEIQRLSESRFQDEWRTWADEEQRRFKNFTTSNDEQWRIHGRAFEELRGRVNEIIAGFTPIQDNIDRLWKFQRSMVDVFRDKLASTLAEYDQVADKASRSPASGLRTTQTMRPIEGK